MKPNETVKKETLFLGIFVLIASVIMVIVFFLFGLFGIGKFGFDIVFGALVGAVVSILNFFLMAMTLQKALEIEDEKRRNSFLKMSQTYRLIGILIVLLVSVMALNLNIYATLIPLLFPRISVFFRQKMLKKEEQNNK